jgi:glycogen synthase
VHVAAELAPYARTGGLGEAVSSLAAHQAATGLPAAIVMPLYRQARARLPRLVPVGDPFEVTVGYRRELGRLFTTARTYGREAPDGKRDCRRALQRAYGLPERDDVPIFGMAARLVWQKGLDLILAETGCSTSTRSSSSSAPGSAATRTRCATGRRARPTACAWTPRSTTPPSTASWPARTCASCPASTSRAG